MRGGDLQDVHKTHPPSLKHSFPPSLLPSFLPSFPGAGAGGWGWGQGEGSGRRRGGQAGTFSLGLVFLLLGVTGAPQRIP